MRLARPLKAKRGSARHHKHIPKLGLHLDRPTQHQAARGAAAGHSLQPAPLHELAAVMPPPPLLCGCRRCAATGCCEERE